MAGYGSEPPRSFWLNEVPAKIDLSTCFGCGKPLRDAPSCFTPDGRQYHVCPGKSLYEPSMKCLRLATGKIYRAGICAGCGKSSFASRGALCPECRTALAHAKSLQAENERLRTTTVEEARDGLIAGFLHDVRAGLYDPMNNGRPAMFGALAEELCGTHDLKGVWTTTGGKLFIALRHVYHEAVLMAYRSGLDEGTSLLRQLNGGNLALNDFDKAKDKAVHAQELTLSHLKAESWIRWPDFSKIVLPSREEAREAPDADEDEDEEEEETED